MTLRLRLGTLTEVTTSVSTWMGDHQGRPGTLNLDPLVGVDLNLRPVSC